VIRPHFATLGGFVLAVVVSAVLGMAVDPVQESASVRSEMDLKILIAGAESNTGHGVEIAGSVSEAHGCVVFVPESEPGYLGVIWPRGSRVQPGKAWLEVDSRLGAAAIGYDYRFGGTLGGPKQLDIPADVQAACPASAYLMIVEID
jgi:hypothetical protein